MDLGLDPLIADTDRDGLSDGMEVLEHHTDPLVPDTDTDGFTDYAEVLLGSNPTDASDTPGLDEDGDGLIDGLDHAPLEPDPDGDGLTDGDEFFRFHTNPANGDTDFDGIDDAEEVAPGDDGFVTDPRDRDTDRDRYSDLGEILAGSDPTDPTSVPSTGLVTVIVHVTTEEGCGFDEEHDHDPEHDAGGFLPDAGLDTGSDLGFGGGFGGDTGCDPTYSDLADALVQIAPAGGGFGEFFCELYTDHHGIILCPEIEAGIDIEVTVVSPFDLVERDVYRVVDQGGNRMQIEVVFADLFGGLGGGFGME